jgi:hypothetical protein
MNKHGAARTQHDPGAGRREETEDGTGRKARPVWKGKTQRATTTGSEHELENDAPGAAHTLPPPHPALVELVRLLARSDARRARAEGKETRR